MSSLRQWQILEQHFSKCSNATKCLLLTSFVKMENLYPEIHTLVHALFLQCIGHLDVEVQQRAVEYLRLHECGPVLMQNVLECMPAFSTNRESALVLRLRATEWHGEEVRSRYIENMSHC